MIILSFVKAIKQLDSLLQQLKGIVDHCVVSFLSFILLISWWFCLNYSPGWSWLSLQFKIEESLKPLNFSKQIFALKTSSRWSFVKTSDLTLNKCISTFNFLTQIVGKLHSYFCTHYFFLAKFKMTTLVADLGYSWIKLNWPKFFCSVCVPSDDIEISRNLSWMSDFVDYFWII